MLFKVPGHLGKLIVGRFIRVTQLVDGLRGPDTGHHVLTLGIHEEFAVEGVFTVGGIPGEGDAGSGVIAHIAENHHLDINGGAPGAGNIVHAAVRDSPVVHPAAEDGADGGHQLHLRILREILSGLFLINGLEAFYKLLHIFSREAGVKLHTAFFLKLIHHKIKLFPVIAHGHVGEHHDEAAIAVIRPAGVAAHCGEAFGDAVINPKVKYGVHHAGHRGPGPGAHGYQQGILPVSKALADQLLHLGKIFEYLRLDLGRYLSAIIIILGTSLCAYSESLGYRHSDIRHFGQIGAFAAE